jgi:spore maturation protein CgeB
MDLECFLSEKKIDLFMTNSHFFYRKQLDYKILKKYRDNGLKVFTKIDFWDSPMDRSGRLNEAKSMKDDIEVVKLIEEGML